MIISFLNYLNYDTIFVKFETIWSNKIKFYVAFTPMRSPATCNYQTKGLLGEPLCFFQLHDYNIPYIYITLMSFWYCDYYHNYRNGLFSILLIPIRYAFWKQKYHCPHFSSTYQTRLGIKGTNKLSQKLQNYNP